MALPFCKILTGFKMLNFLMFDFNHIANILCIKFSPINLDKITCFGNSSSA